MPELHACELRGGIHIQYAAKFKIKAIHRNSVDVEFTVGGEPPQILNLGKHDMTVAHFFIPMDGITVKHDVIPDFLPEDLPPAET